MFPKKLFYFFTVPVVFILWAVVIYQPSFCGPFQFDDNLIIAENPPIRGLGNIAWLWAFDPSRFLTHLSFALNFQFHGMETLGYHIVNFALHLAVSFCVYYFSRHIVYRNLLSSRSEEDMEKLALVATGVFLSHPLQTQAAAYIAQRSTLLAALFYLGTLIFYVEWRQTKKAKFYFWALMISGIGIFTKPNFITLPLALFLCEVVFFDYLRAKNRKILNLLFPFFLMAAVIPALLILWKYKVFDPNLFLNISRETDNISRPTYLLTQFNVLMTYLRLVFIPVGQNLDYDYPLADSFFDMPTPLSFLALCVLFGFAVKMFYRNRLLSFCVFWFFLTLSLESSIFPIADVIFEHRMYLPMVGVTCFLPWLLEKIFQRKYFVGGACLVLVFFSVLSYQRNVLWGDRLALMEDTVRKSPRKARVHNNLGIEYELKGDAERAEKEYKTAIILKRQYSHPHNNLGNIYVSRSDIDKALEYFDAAIAIDPKYPVPLYNKGDIYYRRKDYKKAWDFFQQALKINPFLAPALTGLGLICLQMEDSIKAKFYLTQAIHNDPEYSLAYYALGDLYLFQGEYEMAVTAYKDVLYRDPNHVDAFNNIGNIRSIEGKYEEAIRFYQMAIARDSKYAQAYYNLGNILAKTGRKYGAIQAFTQALKLYEDNNDQIMAAKIKEKLQRLAK